MFHPVKYVPLEAPGAFNFLDDSPAGTEGMASSFSASNATFFPPRFLSAAFLSKT